MRAIGPAGWSSHGFFGFRAKTFGNPTGATSGNGSPVTNTVDAFIDQLAVGGGNVLIAGIYPSVGNPVTAVRLNASLDALATQADMPISVFIPENGVFQAFYAAGDWIATDGTNIASSNNNAETWNLAVSTAGGTINNQYSLVYDDLNGAAIMADSTNTGGVLVSTTLNPLNLSSVAVSASSIIGAVGYKGGATGITLAVAGPGGADNGFVYKSTNGGGAWTQVGAVGFTNAGNFIAFGETHWLSIGTSGTGGAQVQVSLSTDDGTTWTGPAALPGANNNSAAVGAATNGAGLWVIVGANAPPDNYWVSGNDGLTWSSPNAFTAQAGSGPGRVIWNPTTGQFQAVWSDPTETFQFVSTSNDGIHWVAGPTITDTV
jgi:hypothetical protein